MGKLPWTKDPVTFALACSHFGFPTPYNYCAGFSSREVENAWSELAIDRWREQQRATTAQLAELVGGKQARANEDRGAVPSGMVSGMNASNGVSRKRNRVISTDLFVFTIAHRRDRKVLRFRVEH